MLFTLRDVSFVYPDGTQALDKINLAIDQGDFQFVIGGNGSGKTTLLKLLAGQITPTCGDILLNGQVLAQISPGVRDRRIGFFSQTPGKQLLAPAFQRVADYFAYLGLAKPEAEQQVREVFELFGLEGYHSRSLDSLSFGQQKQVALAGILAKEPEVMLLDQPTDGLDPAAGRKLMELLRHITRTKGITLVVATHDVELVPAFASKVNILTGGKIVAQGCPQQVFQDIKLIRTAGLRLPQVSHLFEILERDKGFPVKELPLTIEQAGALLGDYRQYNGKLLRRGFTTGSCAAGAAKAAAIMLRDQQVVKEVKITTPGNTSLRLPVTETEFDDGWAKAAIVKDGGDDPDVTHGLKIFAEVRRKPGEISVTAGEGIGIVTKPGLQVAIGQPAINPVPLAMIKREVGEVFPSGIEVIIGVPGGEETARKTLNPQLGIVGGISILGTTGIVEPMSEEAFKNSLVPQIKMALAAGQDVLVLTPGKIGMKNAVSHGVVPDALIQMSNFVGFMLSECARLGVKRLILFGHIGKLVKVAAGIFHTHSKVADARLETLACFAALAGADKEVLEELFLVPTGEGAIEVLLRRGLKGVFKDIAERASDRCRSYLRQEIEIGTVLTSMTGEILGMDDTARAIGGEKGWFTS